MKFGKLTVIGAVLAASMYLTGIARADSVNGAFYYQYLGAYTNDFEPSAPTTTPLGPTATDPSAPTPTATFTVSNTTSGNVFNFYLGGSGYAGDSDLYNFLTYGGAGVTVTGINGTSGPGIDNINNGVFVFTGYTSLVAGTTYEFTHDDGMMLYLTNGSGTTTTAINGSAATAVDVATCPASGQTVGTDSGGCGTFTVPTTGTYSYEVIYAEVNGAPAVLSADVTSSATPEPSSLLLMGTGLLGLAFALFRKNKSAGLVLHS
jgi:hypothetical protein